MAAGPRRPYRTFVLIADAERCRDLRNDGLGPTDLYQVLDTSDVPAGVINIVTGARDPLAQVLAEHDDEALREAVNVKNVWIPWGA